MNEEQVKDMLETDDDMHNDSVVSLSHQMKEKVETGSQAKLRVEKYLNAHGLKCQEPFVLIPKRAEVGIRLWGQIEGLINYHKYTGWIREQ